MAWHALVIVNASSKERDYITTKARLYYDQRGERLDLLWLFVDQEEFNDITKTVDKTKIEPLKGSETSEKLKTSLKDEDRITEVVKAFRNDEEALEALMSTIEVVWGKEHINYTIIDHYLIASDPQSRFLQTSWMSMNYQEWQESQR